ncbi:response regulator, partial [Thermodesulfobacteriota bacterium]
KSEGHSTSNLKAEPEILEKLGKDGSAAMTQESHLGRTYLSDAGPIKDPTGKIIGGIQLATLEAPVTASVDRLVITFLFVALLGVLMMAGISYFLVQWINRPLELMLNAARRAAEGDLDQEVPVIAHDEVGELAATFNLMIRNLAESRKRLEEWGKELASKVAAQSGELMQAQEQVARVKKLASLEKMADGMAHIMRHISDPIGPALPQSDEEGADGNRILILDSDEKVLELCKSAMADEGFIVRIATTAEHGLKALEEEVFDVVITDVDMPGIDGKDLLREIKFRKPNVTVILTASFKYTEEAVEAVKLGAYDYMPKPFGTHQILLMVYTALQTRQALNRTRKKHAQNRAETIFQRLPVAIALADKAHRVVYNNKAFMDLAFEDGHAGVAEGKTFEELFGVDPLEMNKDTQESPGSRWLELEKVGRTAKLYNFKLVEEDLRVLMLLDITDTVRKDQQADVLRHETITRAQQVIHQQMRVAQEIAGLLGETTAETKAALFELIKLAQQEGEAR